MPFSVIMFLVAVAGVVALFTIHDRVFDGYPKRGTLNLCFIFLLIIFFISGIVWLSVSITDEIDVIGYYTVQSQTFEDGEKQFVIVNENFININERLGCTLPEGTYVRAYVKKSYKNGINWQKPYKIFVDNPVSPASKEDYEKIKKYKSQ